MKGKANFCSRVEIKESETCSWKRHCHGCARDLIGYLELLARQNPHRFVYAQLENLTQHCNGKYRKSGVKPYHQRSVEDALRLLRRHNIVSKQVTMTVNGVERRGFVVAPHSSMTKRYPKACTVVSIGKGSGTWVDGVWIQDPNAAEFFGVIVGDPVAHSVGENVVPTVAHSVGETVGDVDQNCGWDNLEPIEESSVKSVAHEVSTSPILVNRLSHPNQGNLGEPEKPDTDPSSSNVWVTQENQRPSAAREIQTVQQYFNGADDDTLLRKMTDGLLDRENPNAKAFKDWPQLITVCREVIKERAGVPLVNRKILASLIGATIGKLTVIHKRNTMLVKPKTYPALWFKIKHDLMEDGGPLQEYGVKTYSWLDAKRPRVHPLAYRWLHEVFYDAVIETHTDLEPWEGMLSMFRPAGPVTVREGVEVLDIIIDQLKKKDPITPHALLTVRDWLNTRNSCPVG